MSPAWGKAQLLSASSSSRRVKRVRSSRHTFLSFETPGLDSGDITILSPVDFDSILRVDASTHLRRRDRDSHPRTRLSMADQGDHVRPHRGLQRHGEPIHLPCRRLGAGCDPARSKSRLHRDEPRPHGSLDGHGRPSSGPSFLKYSERHLALLEEGRERCAPVERSGTILGQLSSVSRVRVDRSRGRARTKRSWTNRTAATSRVFSIRRAQRRRKYVAEEAQDGTGGSTRRRRRPTIRSASRTAGCRLGRDLLLRVLRRRHLPGLGGNLRGDGAAQEVAATGASRSMTRPQRRNAQRSQSRSRDLRRPCEAELALARSR